MGVSDTAFIRTGSSVRALSSLLAFLAAFLTFMTGPPVTDGPCCTKGMPGVQV